MCFPAKKQFLHDELFSLTLMATVQRGKIYGKNTSKIDRKAFQQDLQRRLEEIAAEYTTTKTGEEHEKNISLLATKLTNAHSAVLRDNRFRIGSAQKALNLFLKYLWCLGEIRQPPHCPFDARIINRFKRKLPTDVPRNWTELVHIDHYKKYVEAALAGVNLDPLKKNLSLAEWELEIYNKTNKR